MASAGGAIVGTAEFRIEVRGVGRGATGWGGEAADALRSDVAVAGDGAAPKFSKSPSCKRMAAVSNLRLRRMVGAMKRGTTGGGTVGLDSRTGTGLGAEATYGRSKMAETTPHTYVCTNARTYTHTINTYARKRAKNEFGVDTESL